MINGDRKTIEIDQIYELVNQYDYSIILLASGSFQGQYRLSALRKLYSTLHVGSYLQLIFVLHLKLASTAPV